MITRLKQKAKNDLAGNWGNAIIGFLGVYFLSSFIGSIPNYIFLPTFEKQLYLLDQQQVESLDFIIPMITTFVLIIVVAMAISIFVVAILQLGYYRFIMDISRTGAADFDALFEGFKEGKYFLRIRAMLLVTLYSFLWMLPYIGLVSISVTMLMQGNEDAVILMMIGGAYMLVIVFVLMRYSMVPYLSIDDFTEYTSAREIVRDSVEMMKGQKFNLFLTGLSFIGWFILSIFTLGLLLIYVVPYMNQTLVNFYFEVSGNEVVKKKPVEDIFSQNDVYNNLM